MIDLKRLQILRFLDRHGTVTAAAHALNLTPSAVSQQIRQLSQDVGADLLERSGRNIRFTPAGRALLDHANALWEQWEIIRAELSAYGRGDRLSRLELCGFPTAIVSLLAPAAARLREMHPELLIGVAESEATDCFDRLLTTQSDIALVVPLPGGPPLNDPRFEQQVLLDDLQDLIVPADHPLADRPSVELSETANEPWIAAPESLDQHRLILVACAAAGFVPRIAHRAQDWSAITALVAAGFGVCLLPRLAPLAAHHGVVRVALHGKLRPSRRILTCIRRGTDRQSNIAHGLDALRDSAGMLDDAPKF